MIELEKIRDLKLESTQKGRPEHLGAGSGLVRRADRLYVIGDDELDLAIFSLADGGPGELVPLFDGDLPSDTAERSREKPDLEALTTLPPFRFNPYGALLALGSGSGESRDWGFAWSLESDGELRGFPRPVNLADLYEHLEGALPGELNIEGVAVTGDRLALFQRGNSEGARSQLVMLSLAQVMHTLTSDFEVDPSELDEVRDYDLGDIGGVELHFSDADALPDGRLVFSATAEADDPEAPPMGSVIGVIGADGTLERVEPVEPSGLKIEGVDAIVADRMIHVLLVCDADEVSVASPLYSATLAE